jgi:hypothetical protein
MGVMWYQLLVGDVSRELHPGWAKELTLRHGVPRSHLDLIDRCVGWFDERPRHAGELLALMRARPVEEAAVPVAAVQVTAVPSPAAVTGRPPAAVTGTAAPVDDLHEEMLHTLVKQLETQHRQFAQQDQSLGVSLGTAGGLGIATFLVLVSSTHSSWGALLAGLLVSGLVGGAIYLSRLGRRGAARERLMLTIHTLTSEFPEEVRAWGGESVLRHPELVAQIARRLGLAPPARPKEEGPAQLEMPTLEPAQRRRLAAQLRPLAKQQAELDGPGTRRHVPFVLALLIGLVLGGAIGSGIGALIFAYRGPVQGYVGGNIYMMRYADYRENSLTEGQYHLDHRKVTTAAVAAGVFSGATVCAVVMLLLAYRTWYRRRLLVGLLLGLLVGAPAGVGTGLLYGGQNAPSWTYVQGGRWGQKEFYDASGRKLDEVAFELAERTAIATTLTAGIGVGLLLVLAVMALSQRWYHRRVVESRQRLAEGVEQLAGSFPQVVAACGGKEALLRPGQIRRCLRAVEAV